MIKIITAVVIAEKIRHTHKVQLRLYIHYEKSNIMIKKTKTIREHNK